MPGLPLLGFSTLCVNNDSLGKMLPAILSDPEPRACFFKPVHWQPFNDLLDIIVPGVCFIPIQKSGFAFLIMKLLRQLPTGKKTFVRFLMCRTSDTVVFLPAFPAKNQGQQDAGAVAGYELLAMDGNIA